MSVERGAGQLVEPCAVSPERTSREQFVNDFNCFLGSLSLADGLMAWADEQAKRNFMERTRRRLEEVKVRFGEEDARLYEATYDLFCIKHSLPPHLPETCEFLRGPGMSGRLAVEIGGSIAGGKTTLAAFLAEQIGAKQIRERFASWDNPFLAKAYENPEFMLRAQISFLLDNIKTGLATKYFSGRWVRDTSVWSDIYVFMEWRRRAGVVKEHEHQVYGKLVDLLNPLIVRPDLLIMLQPNSPERLWEGLQTRIKADQSVRKMESAITMRDLEILCEATEEAVKLFSQKGIKVAAIQIDPVRVWENKELKYSTVYHIREQLGILKELLTKDPQQVAEKIMGILASNREPQVIVVHSPSMFAGKTSVLNFVAEKVGPERVMAFQPKVAIRYGEKHLNHMIDRDGRETNAITVESNRLADVVRLVREKEITPDKYPLLFIDEAMLFVGSNSQEAQLAIEGLRSAGFCVIVDGIDYTFQELPFTFMLDLVGRAGVDLNWHQFEMGTRCKYCDRLAKGSRRLRADGSIADFHDQQFEAGDHYEPVCCRKHKSCLGRPRRVEPVSPID